jgi:transcription-repair coupling factor (superfamily II helicase)
LDLAEIRIDAAVWQISAIYVEDEYLVLRYDDRGRMEQLAQFGGGRLRIVDDCSAYLPADKEVRDPAQILPLVKSVLRPNR